MEKIKGTIKGTIMKKCVKKGNEIRNVSIKEIDELLKNGWEYCSRKEWKVNVRDINKKANISSNTPSTESTSNTPSTSLTESHKITKTTKRDINKSKEIYRRKHKGKYDHITPIFEAFLPPPVRRSDSGGQ